MAFNPKDRFFHKAKKEGFLARSAYKLDELQDKYKIIKSNNWVLDLGAAPGAWSQVASKVIGVGGKVIGLDLKEISWKAPNAKFYQMNAFEFDPAILEGHMMDVVLSDMAPNTTGIRLTDQARSHELCLEVLKIADRYLKTGGHLVMKVFEGPDAQEINKMIQQRFDSVKRIKPEAVRKGSFETYMMGLKKKATNPN